MPTSTPTGLRSPTRRSATAPPLVVLHGASTTGRGSFGAQIPALAEAFRSICRMRAATAGRAGTRRTGSRPAGWSTTSRRSPTRSGSRLPSARLLDGRDDRARVRCARTRTPPDPGRRRDHDGPRAAGERRPPADGPGADRARRSGLGGRDGPDATTRPGPRSLATPPAGDRARHREQPLLTPARAPLDHAPTLVAAAITTRSSRSGRLGAVAPGPRRTALRRPRQRP